LIDDASTKAMTRLDRPGIVMMPALEGL
jgi:hypothetical protein